MNWKCELCDEYYSANRIMDHMRLFHGNTDALPEVWPDGELVIWEDADEFFL